MSKTDLSAASLKLHKKLKGKIAVSPKIKVTSKKELSLAYTPGVAAVSQKTFQDPESAYELTIKANSVAVVSDGSAVLGLGNIGPLGALPVMEGKALLFKEFAGIDAWPIVLDTQDSKEIIQIVKAIAPGFGGINLEDISAPRCFEVEGALQEIGIPVFHDDQHGTAIVILAALTNAAKVVGKKLADLRIVINGAGAAGQAIARILLSTGVGEIILLDSKGIIYQGRGQLDPFKEKLAKLTNQAKIAGDLEKAVNGVDVFIGVSKAGLLTEKMVRTMGQDPIVIALANPVPEIMPDLAKKAGAAIVATGRSDFPNQVNNVLAFPGVFRGALDSRVSQISEEMKLRAAKALAGLVKKPTAENIIPSPFDKRVVKSVAKAVSSLA